MRYKFVILSLLLVFVPSWAMAGCESISDSDKRAYCYAKKNKHWEDCLSIRDNDKRELCKSEAGD